MSLSHDPQTNILIFLFCNYLSCLPLSTNHVCGIYEFARRFHKKHLHFCVTVVSKLAAASSNAILFQIMVFAQEFHCYFNS